MDRLLESGQDRINNVAPAVLPSPTYLAMYKRVLPRTSKLKNNQ